MRVLELTPGWIWSWAAVSILEDVGRVLVNRLDTNYNRAYMSPFTLYGYPGWALPPRPWGISEWMDVWYYRLGWVE